MRGGMRAEPQDGEHGYLLVAMVVAIFLILLALSVAAPRIATQLRREREVETAHRANQYVRGIRMYYKKFNSYPASMEALKKSNNIRFLRQEYVDPLTGEKDWKLIRVGQNKTKVKGFFGEDLPGIAGGLGAAAGLSSATPALGSASGSGFGASGTGAGGASGTGAGGTASGSGSTSSGSSFGSSTFASSTDSLNGGVGPFMGVGVPKTGPSILVVNEQANYEDWEFLYDPRIEQLYAKGSLLGGGLTSGGGSGSLGTLGGSTSPSPGNGGTTPTSPTGPASGSPTTPPATPQ
jgi:type II secretory pathway pseudopilin PulG